MEFFCFSAQTGYLAGASPSLPPPHSRPALTRLHPTRFRFFVEFNANLITNFDGENLQVLHALLLKAKGIDKKQLKDVIDAPQFESLEPKTLTATLEDNHILVSMGRNHYVISQHLFNHFKAKLVVRAVVEK